MVYINSFNAFVGVGMIVLLSLFIIFVAYLWIQNLQNKAADAVQNVGYECNCLDVLSDNGETLLIMNVNCEFVENLFVVIENEVFRANNTLYYEDLFAADYNSASDNFVAIYNNCTEFFNK